MRFLFRAFGCLTIVVFFFGLTLYILVTTNPPMPAAAPEIQQIVYPAALASLKVGFNEMFQSLATGVVARTFVITELEANAALSPRFATDTSIIQNMYVSFKDDETIRVRFDVSLNHLKRFLESRMEGKKLDENIENVRRLIRSGSLGRAVVITVDARFHWNEDRPVLSLEHVYVGMLPLPMLVEFVNAYMGDMNKNFAKMVDNWNRGTNTFMLLRKIEVKDRMVVMDFEAKVTPEWIKRQEMMKFYKENKDIFTPAWTRLGCPAEGCSPDTQKNMRTFIQKLSGKDPREITKQDAEDLRRTLGGGE